MKNISQIQFWNDSYQGGKTYRQFSFIELEYFISHGYIKGKVLDIGCGTGEFSIRLSQYGYEVLGIDISDIAIQKAKASAKLVGVNANFKVEEIENIFDSFDTVTCKLVYAFVKDKETFNKKIVSILNSGGTFFIYTPVITEENKNKILKPSICVTLREIEDLKKIYTSVEIKKVHENAESEEYLVVCKK